MDKQLQVARIGKEAFMHSFFKLSLGIAALSFALVLSGCVVTSMVAETDAGSSSAQVTSSETFDGVTADKLRVFVTSTTYTGSALAGVGGANAACRARALAAGLTQRNYAALIRHSTGYGYSNISTNKPIVIYDASVSGGRETVLADSLTAVFAGQSLTETINITESSASLSTASTIPVWTGMTTTGTTHANHCAKWLASGTGRLGDASQKDNRFFSNANSTNCEVANPARLYCIGEVGKSVNYTLESAGGGMGVGGGGSSASSGGGAEI